MAKFRPGDLVRCEMNHYSGIRRGDTRVVLAVRRSNAGNELIQLVNHDSPIGTSDYHAMYFNLVQRKKDVPMPPAEATKYFAMKLNVCYPDTPDCGGLILDPVGKLHPGDMSGDVDTTPLRNNQHEVRVDVNKRIAEGDKWLVVRTVVLLEGEEPRPPIRVTEFK